MTSAHSQRPGHQDRRAHGNQCGEPVIARPREPLRDPRADAGGGVELHRGDARQALPRGSSRAAGKADRDQRRTFAGSVRNESDSGWRTLEAWTTAFGSRRFYHFRIYIHGLKAGRFDMERPVAPAIAECSSRGSTTGQEPIRNGGLHADQLTPGRAHDNQRHVGWTARTRPRTGLAATTTAEAESHDAHEQAAAGKLSAQLFHWSSPALPALLASAPLAPPGELPASAPRAPLANCRRVRRTPWRTAGVGSARAP